MEIINCDNNNNSNYEYYYLTENVALGTDDMPIKPQYNKQTIFEYGIGFYLTPDYEVAINYAKSKSRTSTKLNNGEKYYNKDIDLNIDTDIEFFDNFLGEIPNVNVYLHTFISNNDIINNKSYKSKIFETKEDYLVEVEKILESYKNNNLNNPDRDFSYGLIVGQYWDEYFEDKKSSNIDVKKDLDYIKKFFEISTNKSYRQFVIHKDKIDGNDFKHLFKHNIEKISVKEMERRYKNGRS